MAKEVAPVQVGDKEAGVPHRKDSKRSARETRRQRLTCAHPSCSSLALSLSPACSRAVGTLSLSSHAPPSRLADVSVSDLTPLGTVN